MKLFFYRCIKIKSLVVYALGLSFCTTLFAQDLAQTQFSSDWQNTSDGIFQNTWTGRYRSRRSDMFWPYSNESESGPGWGANVSWSRGTNASTSYQGTSAQAVFSEKFSQRAWLELTAGDHHLNNITSTQQTDFLTARLETLVALNSFNLNLVANRDFIYADLYQPGGVTQALSAQSLYLDLQYRPQEKWRFLSRNSYRWISDGNQRREFDLSTMYGVSIGVPWIWMGLGADLLSYANTSPGYWSPSQFASMGPRFEFVVPLLGAFSGTYALNVNRIDEVGSSPGLSFYAVAGLQYGTREALLIELAYTRIQSSQNGNTWNDDGAKISLQNSF